MLIRPVSIIVCTHNRAALLPNIINQLSTQDYPKGSFEIIIVDNCSTDDTPQVVQRFISDHKLPLRYIREDRPGVTNARNRGAEEAIFPYLAYLDDDCSVDMDWLPELISGFKLDDRVSVVAGRIALDYDNQKVPSWLGEKSERWLGKYDFPDSQPLLLDNAVYVCEGNMAITREAWRAAGGFLGMDQFRSPHMAAQEIVYLLEQVKRRGGKVAFVRGAVANHHTVIPTWQRMLMRAYWHGVSDSILDQLLERFSWASAFVHAILDTAAMFVFLCLSFLALLLYDKATSMYHLLRATARFGKVLSLLRLVGDWRRVHQWMSARHDLATHT